MPREPFIRRVKLRNFKSIAECDVELGRLTLMVGRNGAGKSNFLDALRFVADALQAPLDLAIKSRGGIDAVRRRSTGHPRNFEMQFELFLDEGFADYRFEVGSAEKRGFRVVSESLSISSYASEPLHRYKVDHKSGIIRESTSISDPPPPSSDRLYLVNASGRPEFRPVYDALTAMGFYNLNPEVMKDLQEPDAGDLLRRDGSNLASVVARLAEDRPNVHARICEYLSVVVPDVDDFRRVSLGHRETLEFRQAVRGSGHPWKFHAASMSDGTLRTLGILVAAMQLVGHASPARFVGIEEPETALHPAAAGALMDALREASEETQILATTHSPDLLDRFDPDSDSLLVAVSNQGTTEIGPADPASVQAIRGHLFTPGELLRMDQLEPAPRPPERQRDLFEQAAGDR